MKSSVLYGFHDTQIFSAIVTVNSVDVINLLINLKRFDKSVGYQTMHQKTFASFCTKATAAKSHLNIRFSAPVVFFS